MLWLGQQEQVVMFSFLGKYLTPKWDETHLRVQKTFLLADILTWQNSGYACINIAFTLLKHKGEISMRLTVCGWSTDNA